MTIAEKNEVFKDGKLESDESFEAMKLFIQEEISLVKEDPQVGVKYLYKTGMYDKKGQLKPEFA